MRRSTGHPAHRLANIFRDQVQLVCINFIRARLVALKSVQGEFRGHPARIDLTNADSIRVTSVSAVSPNFAAL